MRKQQLRLQPKRFGQGEIPHLKIMPRWKLAMGALAALFAALLARSKRPLHFLLGSSLAGGALGLAALIYGRKEARSPRLRELSLPIAGLPASFSGLVAAHISDLHLEGPETLDNLRQVRHWLDQRRPELILITGDFISDPQGLLLLEQELAGLSAPLGVYAVLGNHDYWNGPAELDQSLTRLGIRLLVNEHVVLERGAQQLVVAGVDDPWYGHARLDQALAGAPEQAPVILLAHCSDYVVCAAQQRIALQLSGHAHAGHMRLPLLGPAILPLHGRRYPCGLYQHEETLLYVSTGLGGRPVRIGAAPEMTLLHLGRAPADPRTSAPEPARQEQPVYAA